MSKQIIRTDKAPAPAGPYSQAVIANGFVFVAGQVGIDAATGEVVEGGIEGQTHCIFANLNAILQAAGSSFENVVKANVYLQHMDDFAVMNDIYAQYLSGDSPVRTTIEAARLPKGLLIEIDVIAVV